MAAWEAADKVFDAMLERGSAYGILIRVVDEPPVVDFERTGVGGAIAYVLGPEVKRNTATVGGKDVLGEIHSAAAVAIENEAALNVINSYGKYGATAREFELHNLKMKVEIDEECTGQNTSVPLCFEGCHFYYGNKGFMSQGGGICAGDGNGRESTYGLILEGENEHQILLMNAEEEEEKTIEEMLAEYEKLNSEGFVGGLEMKPNYKVVAPYRSWTKHVDIRSLDKKKPAIFDILVLDVALEKMVMEEMESIDKENDLKVRGYDSTKLLVAATDDIRTYNVLSAIELQGLASDKDPRIVICVFKACNADIDAI